MNAEATSDDLPKELAFDQRGDPARMHDASHVFGFKHHLVSAALNPHDLLRFEYFSRCAGALRAGDFVFCEPADRSWWTIIRVLQVCGEGCVTEPIWGKETEGYRPPPPKRGPLGTNADEFTYELSEEFPDRWAVVRTHDKIVMTRGQPLTRGQCEEWLMRHLVTVRRK